jgi:hypothetical protein
MRLLEEFTIDNRAFSALITRFFVFKQLAIAIGVIVSLVIYN